MDKLFSTSTKGIIATKDCCTGCGTEEYRSDKTNIPCEICEIARRYLCELISGLSRIDRGLERMEQEHHRVWSIAVTFAINSKSEWKEVGS